MFGWVVLLVGILLCFLGIGSIHLAILASGFGVGWLLADVFGAGELTALWTALGSAVLAWVVVTLVFKVAAFFVGVITGGLIGARLSAILTTGEANVALSVVVVISVALTCGFLADRYRNRVLLWSTAIGGAGLVLSGLGLIAPGTLGVLRDPQTAMEQVTSMVLWVALGAGGWITQRALFPKALREKKHSVA